ncbi:helix-turn-helix transcriptional regulator [Curtobacterium sp. MCPF17_002]|uniref:helix-turn-helix domain-containing protein n=1 Tax=Curtobacterium sp. MCPF17_002 TaxID=2175645 RepID=UPI0011B5C29F|nr:helix-turn-helix transcriptional regulator [Curtobacterium sp. MCPF17_002]WIB77725.1 helix-turn-helix transcriptional regulator [Curtobacterium sp. MCPF17_002]
MDRVLLTERQVEILVLLAWGEPVRCIAKELYLSAATVNYHLGRLRRIFGAQSLPSLVAAASVAGILTSDQLPVQGTGRLDVAPSEQSWDRASPLWTPHALAGADQADPTHFAPDHSARSAAVTAAAFVQVEKII